MTLVGTSAGTSARCAEKRLPQRKLTLLMLLVAWLSVAGDVWGLPFLGPEKDFNLRFITDEGNKKNFSKLREMITAELTQLKESSATLKQYSSQYKIDRYQADAIRQVLKAEGYYSSEVGHERRNEVTYYTIRPGPQYTVRDLSIKFPKDIPEPDKSLLGISEGQPLRAEAVLAAEDIIRDWISVNLCLYQVDVGYQAAVYHQDQTATLTYTLQPTQRVEVGELRVTGTETVEEEYLRERLPIQTGSCFNRQRVDMARLALLQTNLVTSVDANVGQPQEGRVPLTFNIAERSHRTVRAGVSYDTVLGPGVLLGWEHRNLLGHAENLDISLRVSEMETLLQSELTVPHFKKENQSLVLHADAFREQPDAYDTTGADIGAALARQVTPELFGSLGVQLRYSRVRDQETTENFLLFSVPFNIEYDTRDSILNPQAGWRTSLAVEPFTDIRSSDRRFVKTSLSGQMLHTIEGWPTEPTFAGRISTGTITGVRRERVPADLRYYVGGGGSVRGYPYQSLGDLDEEGDPLGGRSYTEIALETRFRFSQSWGGVLFLDGGYAYPEELPSLGENLLWGTGFGIRYLTDFAPIRFDVGFPLDRRDQVDDSFQLYISLGQAF